MEGSVSPSSSRISRAPSGENVKKLNRPRAPSLANASTIEAVVATRKLVASPARELTFCAKMKRFFGCSKGNKVLHQEEFQLTPENYLEYNEAWPVNAEERAIQILETKPGYSLCLFKDPMYEAKETLSEQAAILNMVSVLY